MTEMPDRFQRRRRGRFRAGRAPVLWAAAVLVVGLAVTPAHAWNDDAHVLIVDEAVQRLPEPLRGLLSAGDAPTRLRQAALAPDAWRKRGSDHYSPAEKPRHFFDLDAITDEAPPFPTFPRRLEEIETKFGAETLDREGRGPWAVRSAMRRLTDALIRRRPDDFFRAAGEVAHYASDLHMPFHATKNYDGQLSGNPGVHAAVEVGLLKRSPDFYADAVRQGRTPVAYLSDLDGATIDWAIQANALVPTLLEADTVARQRSGGYNPKDHEKPPPDEAGRAATPGDPDNPDADAARPYYAALAEELQARQSPLATQMRDAAAHLAQLYYTAWVDAGKPLSLSPTEADGEDGSSSWWTLGAIALGLLILFGPRRRPATPKASS